MSAALELEHCDVPPVEHTPIQSDIADVYVDTLLKDSGRGETAGPWPSVPGDGVETLRRSKYCMSKSDIFTAIVEDTVFELHSFFFKRESERFRKLLKDHNGTSHILLPDTTAIDLERFLDLLYPSHIGDYSGKTPEEWMSILRVAYRWGFDSIHKFAVDHLDMVASPVDKVVCARTLGVEDWLIGAYVVLCSRKEPLTLEEGRRLGLEEVICLYDARDEAGRSGQKKAGDLRAIVERKLEAHGLAAQSKKTPHSEATCEPEGSRASKDLNDAQNKPGTASADAMYTYTPPRLDILDQTGKTILGAELEEETTWRLYPSELPLRMIREERKLIVESPSDDVVYVNGRGREGRIELQHGDVIAFARHAALSESCGSVLCQPDTGYVVCRNDTLASSAEWTESTGWCRIQYKHGQEGGDLFKEWKRQISDCDRTVTTRWQSLAARSLCIVHGKLGGDEELARLRKEIDTAVEKRKDPMLKAIGAALQHARNPLTMEGWQRYRE